MIQFLHRRIPTPFSVIKMPFRPPFSVFCFLLSVLCLAGCSHYQLGTGGKLAFHTLYLAPVENKSSVPDARAIVSTRLREAFARDGRVALANSPETADATLTVVLTDYHRDPATAREGDTALARKFNVTLGALCTLSDGRPGAAGKTFFANRPVNVQREVFTDSGQLSAEYQTLPLLAESLATKVSHTVLDVW